MATTSGLTPWMKRAVKELTRILKARGIRVTIYSAKRTARQQAALVARGDSTARVSKHQLGRAVDLILNPPKYAEAGAIWTKLGGIWGGNFSNPAVASVEFQHFEDSSRQPSQTPQLLSRSRTRLSSSRLPVKRSRALSRVSRRKRGR